MRCFTDYMHLRDETLRVNLVPKQQILKQSEHPISGTLKGRGDIQEECLQSADNFIPWKSII